MMTRHSPSLWRTELKKRRKKGRMKERKKGRKKGKMEGRRKKGRREWNTNRRDLNNTQGRLCWQWILNTIPDS